MKLHERHDPTTTAKLEIETGVISAIEKHGLTHLEVIQILAGLTQIQCKYAIRGERHGDEGKPGGLA